MRTHRSSAHLVTFLPSFRQCSGSLFSFLQSIKSALYSLQYSPMKKDALFNGADVRPISSTGGTDFGAGVGSTNLVDVKVGSRVAVMSGEKSRPQRLLYWICVSQGGLIVRLLY
jgi:hypothetical protein